MRVSRVTFARRGLLSLPFFSIIAVAFLVSAQAPSQQAPENAQKAPETIVFRSPIGQVDFPHQMHSEDLGIDCADCHHPIKAPQLETPHPQYFENSTVHCKTCHHAQNTQPAEQKCSVCHDSEAVIPHHQLSAKVAIHTLCSGCHEIGTGQDASSSCSNCHSGPKSAW